MKRDVQVIVDEFISSRAALVLALAWGFAEATFFFIVPDVLLTLIAIRALRPALKASLLALAGALTGGVLMYLLGASNPRLALQLLDRIPAISWEKIGTVHTQIDESGLLAVLLGPLKGIPYKIFAVDWGARRGSFIAFILISIPARYFRFLVTALIARAAAKLIQPITHHRAAIELTILTVIWIIFYALYFMAFTR
jgi:membrane protein YqaA with SNARE-associated domain